MRRALKVKLCSHGAVQCVVCCHDLTSKLLVALLYVNVV